ncbi:MAG: FtsX-like permease family protein [Coprothermobacterota bacterium]|nr:FtsX-like permease family protein [Coprothermobacterota bacterium]
MIFYYAWRLVVRNSRRTWTYLFGLALAVGLFAGILFFVDATTYRMTTLALAPVKLDLVAHATRPDVDVASTIPTLTTQRGILAAEPVAAADFTTAMKVGGVQTSPAGRVFAISPSYLKTFDILQISEGQFDPHGVMVSEAMAIAQNLKVGDSLQITFAGVDKPVVLPITGIVNLDNADALFATTTEAENAIVADTAFMDFNWFQSHLQTPLTAIAANPPANLTPGAIMFDPQVHIKIDRALLPSDPTLAALHADSLRRQVERQFPGQLKAVDNLSGALLSAKGDVLAAKILLIFLGLPGVALAAYLSKFAAELFAESQRREISLLRTRGAAPAQIAGIVAASSVLLAIGGSALGLVVGLILLVISAQATGSLNPFAAGFDWGAFANSASIAFLAGLILTFLAAFLPTFGALRREITQGRRVARRSETAPFWKRTYLDVMALVAAGIILLVTQLNGGFKPSGNEGQAVTLSFYIFLAPFFTWVGLTLLIQRLVEGGVSRLGARLASLFRHIFGEIGEAAGKSVARRAARIGAATTVIALTLSFGVSLSLFQGTYASEKQLDSQYIVGANVRFTPALNTPQTADFARQLQIPGVQSVTAVARDPQALVGAEKNTVYGVDVASFRTTAYLPDTFFVDGATPQTVAAMRDRTTNYSPGSAQQVLDALANTPNGVIISVEQAEKYNIQVGDPVLLRLYNRVNKHYTDVKTQAVGFFIYFPTSAQDSDFILNRDFMITSSGYSAIDYFLLKTDPSPSTVNQVAATLTAKYKDLIPVRIQTTENVIKNETSSLTSLNLSGLGVMEMFYTVLVISLGLAIFLLAMVNERQREFGTMRALGANLGHLRRFLFAEAGTIGVLSLLIGTVVGVALAFLLVMLLGVIFTIPAHGLSLPGLELLGLAALVVIGMITSTLFSARKLTSLKVVEALREL